MVPTTRAALAVSSGSVQVRSPRLPSSAPSTTITPSTTTGARPPAQLALHIPKCALNAYVGLTGAVLGSCTSSFVYFVTYEKVRGFLDAHFPGEGLPGLKHVVCASAGALTSAVVRVPSDVIKHRVQAGMYPSIRAAASSIVQKEGVKVRCARAA
jgi:solute carrier family 25 S-adenosylmethionine transporter 26